MHNKHEMFSFNSEYDDKSVHFRGKYFGTNTVSKNRYQNHS